MRGGYDAALSSLNTRQYERYNYIFDDQTGQTYKSENIQSSSRVFSKSQPPREITPLQVPAES